MAKSPAEEGIGMEDITMTYEKMKMPRTICLNFENDKISQEILKDNIMKYGLCNATCKKYIAGLETLP